MKKTDGLEKNGIRKSVNKLFAMFCLFIPMVFVMACSKSPGFSSESGEDLSSKKSFTSFVIEKRYHSGLDRDIRASINNENKTIVATVRQTLPVDLKKIRPTFSFEGAYTTINNEVVKSTAIVLNFSHPVYCRLYAEDGTYSDYTIVVNFASTWQFRPEASSLAIVGDVIAGEKLTPDYTFIDRNGNREKGTKIEWRIETARFSGEYQTVKTYFLSDPDVALSDHVSSKSDAFYTVPSGKEGFRVELAVTPHAEFNDDPEMDFDEAQTVGFETTKTAAYCIKESGSYAGVLINEIRSVDSSSDISDEGDQPDSECIVLYNSRNNASIDLNGLHLQVYQGGWKDYCIIGDTGTNFIKPASWSVNTEIGPKSYFLIASRTAPVQVKRRADIVINNDALDMPSSQGSLRLYDTASGHVIDLVGYGENPAHYEGPAPSASDPPGTLKAPPAPEPRASIVRSSCRDTNNNTADFVPRMPVLPRGSGKNGFALDQCPPAVSNVVIEEVIEDPLPGNGSDTKFRVSYTYTDWQYASSDNVIIKWHVKYKDTDGSFYEVRECLMPETHGSHCTCHDDENPKDKFVSAPFPQKKAALEAKEFVLTVNDFYNIPEGIEPCVSVDVYPLLSDEDFSKIKLVHSEYTSVEDLGECDQYYTDAAGDAVALIPDSPARLRIARLYPAQNIVEVTAVRGGYFTELFLAVTHSSINELFAENGMFTNTGSTYSYNIDFTANFVTVVNAIFTDTDISTIDLTAYPDKNVIKFGESRFFITEFLPAVGDPWYNEDLIQTSFRFEMAKESLSNGVVVEIYEKVGESEYIENGVPVTMDEYFTQDMVVFTLGTPGEVSAALKRHLILSNKSARSVAGVEGVWAVDNDEDYTEEDWARFYDKPFNEEGVPTLFYCSKASVENGVSYSGDMTEDGEAFSCVNEGDSTYLIHADPSDVEMTDIVNADETYLVIPNTSTIKTYPLFFVGGEANYANDVPWYWLNITNLSAIPSDLWTFYHGYFSVDVADLKVRALGRMDCLIDGSYYAADSAEAPVIDIPRFTPVGAGPEIKHFYFVFDESGYRLEESIGVLDVLYIADISLEAEVTGVDGEGEDIIEYTVTGIEDMVTYFHSGVAWYEAQPAFPSNIYIERSAAPKSGVPNKKSDYTISTITNPAVDAPWNKGKLPWED